MQAGTSAGILAAGMVLNAASTAEAAAAARGGSPLTLRETETT